MSAPSPADHGSLPLTQEARVDQVCVRFEACWKSGQRPRIEEFLAGAIGPERAVLLEELLKLDLIYRRRLGEQPQAEHYQALFAGQEDQLYRLFRSGEATEVETRPSPPAASRPVPDRVWLPGYEVLGELGRGGMGVVYRARQVSLNRVVAVKMIRSAELAGPAERSRFQREAEAVARLQNPNIVQVFEVGEHDGRPFIAQELVEGGNLAGKLAGTPLPPEAAARLVETLARAVQHAHSRGVIHRDLKPANILLHNEEWPQKGTKDAKETPKDVPTPTPPSSPFFASFATFCGQFGTPKITDFGLAKRLDADDCQTQTGLVLGTPKYMAPEQAEGRSKEIGPAADGWALGAILYECLTGRPPFGGATTAETLEQVRWHEPVPPARLNPKVPRDLETICLKCLQKEPGRRYGSAEALADDLRRFLHREPIHARPVSRLTRLWLWSRRNPALTAAGGLTAAALLAVAGLSVAFGVVQNRTNAELREALTKVQRHAALAIWDRGRGLCEEGEVGYGLLRLAEALRTAPPGDAALQEALRLELAGWHRRCHTLHEALEHPRAVSAVAVSPDGKWLLTGCDDGKARLWDLQSGTCLHTLAAHEGRVLAVAFRGDGRVFLTGGGDRTARLWKAGTDGCLATLAGHKGAVSTVALSPDGSAALTGSVDATVCLWDIPAGTLRAAVGHAGPVETVVFSPDGRRFLTGGEKGKSGGEVRLWKVGPSGCDEEPLLLAKERQPYTFRKKVGAVAFSPDGRTLLIGDDDWEGTLWDLGSRQLIAVLVPSGSVRAVAFSADGRTALTGAPNAAAAHLWDVDRLREQWRRQGRAANEAKPLHPPLPHPLPVTGVAFGPDGRVLVTSCEDGNVRIWRKAAGEPALALGHSPGVRLRAVAFQPHGELVATGSHDGTVRLWNARTGTPDGEPLPHGKSIKNLAFTPDGRTLLTDSSAGPIRFWDVATRKEIHPPRPHSAEGVFEVFSPDARWILTMWKNGRVGIWGVGGGDAPRGEPLWPGGLRPINFATVSPDGRRALIADHDGGVWLGKIADVQPFGKIATHPGAVRTLGFSHDSLTALSGGHDARVCLWDVADRASLRLTLTHRSQVTAAVFSPNGRLVLTSADDEEEEGCQLWDARLGRRVGPGYQHRKTIDEVALSPDGRTALLGGYDGWAILWRLPEPLQGDVERIACWVKTIVGMELDEGSGRRVLERASWQRFRQRLREPGGVP